MEGAPELKGLRWMVATGEALPPELCAQWIEAYPGVPLLNAYGPTECSDDVTHHRVREVPTAAHVPIGRSVANMRLYLLDRRGQPAPIGVPGELFVGGVGVGRGYLRDPRRTADVFLPDGMNVNLELVRNGWCWWYQQYAPDNVIFAELQRRARRAGIGLWADPRPVPPWEWRKRNGGALKQRAVSN